MQLIAVLVFGSIFSSIGFALGAWWSATHTGSSIAVGLQKAMRKGVITEADAASILDWIDEA